MATSTNDYKTQIELLINFFSARRETIFNQWQTKISLEEGLHLPTSSFRGKFMDHLPTLLHIFNRRIAGDGQEIELVELVGQYGLHGEQQAYSLTDLFTEVDNFYKVIDEELRQFLVLYPQTQPQVIAQMYRQLQLLSQDVTRERLLSVDGVGQMTAFEQLQPLHLSRNSLQQQNNELANYLQQSSHELRNQLGIITVAANLLQKPLKSADRTKYMDMLSRNVKSAELLLNQLLEHVTQTGSKPTWH